MAETENQDEPTLHSKRKGDDISHEDNQKKAQKVGLPDNNNSIQTLETTSPANNSSIVEEKHDKVEPDLDADDEEHEDEDDDDDDDDQDEEEDEDEDEDDDDEVDRKGKGIKKDDKGKGKLIEEDDDEDDSDSDSDTGTNLSGGDSDLSDDPLAEVDLDNILPSRTRRRAVQPGVYIANDLGNDGDDDSDDSDA